MGNQTKDFWWQTPSDCFRNILACVPRKRKFESRWTVDYITVFGTMSFKTLYLYTLYETAYRIHRFFVSLKLRFMLAQSWANVEPTDRCKRLHITFRIFSVLTVLGNFHVCRWMNYSILVETMTEIPCHWANADALWWHFDLISFHQWDELSLNAILLLFSMEWSLSSYLFRN